MTKSWERAEDHTQDTVCMAHVGCPSSILHLLYHELTDTVPVHAYQLTTARFRAHLTLLAELPSSGPICPQLTFDDGHRSNYDFAFPLLQEYGTKAIFFITAGWTKECRANYMSWENIRSLAQAGHVIGAHGWSHALLTHCDDRKLRVELGDAKKVLEDNIGSSVRSLSFPGGRFDARVVDAALATGYTTLYTSLPKLEKLPLGRLVGRANVRRSWTSKYLASLFAKNNSVVARLRYGGKLKETAKYFLGDSLYARLWSAVNGKQVETESPEERRA